MYCALIYIAEVLISASLRHKLEDRGAKPGAALFMMPTGSCDSSFLSFI